MRVAVVGHVEWVEFVRLARVPASGEIVHAEEWWEEPGGGGAVAAGQLLKLAGSCLFLTALGRGDRSLPVLREQGLEVHACERPDEARRKLAFVDAGGERTLTVLGSRLVPWRSDDLPWELLESCDAVYFTGGDAAALRAARAARVLVATPRAQPVLTESGVELDALVGSGSDAGERYRPGDIDPEPRLVVQTAGARGGSWSAADGGSGTWAAHDVPGEVADAYGCGDSFAAGLTYGLGAGMPVEEAVELAARCGAEALARRGAWASGPAGSSAG